MKLKHQLSPPRGSFKGLIQLYSSQFLHARYTEIEGVLPLHLLHFPSGWIKNLIEKEMEKLKEFDGSGWLDPLIIPLPNP